MCLIATIPDGVFYDYYPKIPLQGVNRTGAYTPTRGKASDNDRIDILRLQTLTKIGSKERRGVTFFNNGAVVQFG